MRGFPHAEQFFNYKPGVYVDHECGDKEVWDDMDNAGLLLFVSLSSVLFAQCLSMIFHVVMVHDEHLAVAVIVTLVGLQHPESRGWVRLQSTDPLDPPLIQPNYLKEQHDVNVLMEGHRIMTEVMSQPSLRKMWDYRMDCKTYGDIDGDEDNLERYIRDSIVNIYHPVGKCKMSWY